MTESQKRQIYAMRLNGSGYKAIASALGLGRDKVRNYCKRYGLDGAAEELKVKADEKKERHTLCAQCGKPVVQSKTGRARRFCCDGCRRLWWRDNGDKRKPKAGAFYQFTCAACGRAFESYGNRARKYCCHECYIKARFERSKQHA